MTHKRRARRDRGVTLLELLMSLVVIITGLLVLFRTLASSVQGSQTSSRSAQAQERAATIIEAIRLAPTNAVTCLINTAPANWSNCETVCKSLQTAGPGADASTCIFTPQAFGTIKGPTYLDPNTGTNITDQSLDRQGQRYFLVPGVAPQNAANPANMRSTYVRLVGDGLRTREVVITIGWNDDNTPLTVGVTPSHTVSLATGVFL